MKRPVSNIPRNVVITILILFIASWFESGAIIRYLPRYQQKNLLGLTHQQVIARLGQPSYDPSQPYSYGGPPPAGWATTQPGWTNEPNDGPLVIGYYKSWTTCRIEFHNNRAVSVEFLEK